MAEEIDVKVREELTKIKGLVCEQSLRVYLEKYHFFEFRGRLRRPPKEQKINVRYQMPRNPSSNGLELPQGPNAVTVIGEVAVEDVEAGRGEAPNNQIVTTNLLASAHIGGRIIVI